MAKSHVATPFRRMVLEVSLLADGRFSFLFCLSYFSCVEEISWFVSDCVTRKKRDCG